MLARCFGWATKVEDTALPGSICGCRIMRDCCATFACQVESGDVIASEVQRRNQPARQCWPCCASTVKAHGVFVALEPAPASRVS